MREEFGSQMSQMREEFGSQMSQMREESGSQMSQMRSEIRSDRKLLIFASLALFSAAIAMVGMAARLFVQ